MLRLGLINILTPYRLDWFSPKQIPTQTPSSGKSICCPCLLLPRWVFHPCEYRTGTPWAYRDARRSQHQRCNSSQTTKGCTHFVRRQAVSYRFQLESPFKHSNLKKMNPCNSSVTISLILGVAWGATASFRVCCCHL